MSDEKKESLNWGMLCHVGGLATYIGIPFGNIIAPLVIWLWKKKTVPSVEVEGREALNFNLSFSLYGILAGLMCYIMIGFVLLPLVIITHLVLVIRAILQANKGESVHYPFTLRFINP
jgi:uncharacterized Tic20 family protein